MSESDLSVNAQLNIAKAISEVFEAIVNPSQMAGYFISTGSGRLDGGQPVTWSWSDCGAEATVTPQKVETDHRIEFDWCPQMPGDSARVTTRVCIELESTQPRATIVKVREVGWARDSAGVTRCLEQTQGWMHMLCCLKAWLEFGINLRQGPEADITPA